MTINMRRRVRSCEVYETAKYGSARPTSNRQRLYRARLWQNWVVDLLVLYPRQIANTGLFRS